MYIVAIAWLYVTLLMAVSEPSFVAGFMTFLTFGLGPLAIFLWIMGSGHRRRKAAQAAQAQSSEAMSTIEGAGEEPGIPTPSVSSHPTKSSPPSDR